MEEEDSLLLTNASTFEEITDKLFMEEQDSLLLTNTSTFEETQRGYLCLEIITLSYENRMTELLRVHIGQNTGQSWSEIEIEFEEMKASLKERGKGHRTSP